MARCTAPVLGHRSASAAANCPACGSRGSRYGRYGGYSSYESYSSPVLLLFGEWWGRPEQQRRVRKQRKTTLVASRFAGGLHAYRGAGTHAGPQQRREPSETA